MAYNQYPFYNNYFGYPTAQQPVQMTIQNGGLVTVQSEQEAKDYLVAQGTSVTFLDQKNKMLYIKTRGFSSMDTPQFEKYKLTREKIGSEDFCSSESNYDGAVEKTEISALKAEIDEIKSAIAEMEAKNGEKCG